jgi:hypothetical protein
MRDDPNDYSTLTDELDQQLKAFEQPDAQDH